MTVSPADEKPQHCVTLAEYWIDRCPLTNAQFAVFVDAAGYQVQGPWRDDFAPGKERHPMVNVDGQRHLERRAHRRPQHLI